MLYPRIFASFYGILLVILLAGCAVNPVTGKSELAFYNVSESEEIKLGQKSFGNAVQQMSGVYQDQALNNYVDAVGQRLAKVSHRPHLPYKFQVVNDSSPNAFALPGGPIAITRGLLVGLENEAQLAAVLGHEIGHVTARHAVQGLQRNMLWSLGAAVIAGATSDTSYGPIARQAGQLSATLLENSYSREQESESDRLGIDYMVAAGYDPVGAIQLQEFFLKKSEGEKNPSWLTGLFRTHPFSRDRMGANQNYIHTRYPNAVNNPNFILGPQQFLEATKGLRATQKAYDLYDQGQQQESKNNLAGTIDLYRQAVRAAPDQALIHTGLGLALLKTDKVNEAGAHFSQAVKLDPNYYASRLGLGYVLLNQHNYNASVEELQQSMKLRPTLGGAFFLAEGYEKTGQFQKAFDLYSEVAAADPNGKMGQTAAVRARALSGP